MRRSAPLSPLLALLLPLAACSGSDPDDTAAGTDWSTVPRGDCNPVDDGQCLLPFPSSFYLKDDASTGSGFRVDFGPTSLPADQFGVQMDPASWNQLDGFPILGPLYALLPGASLDGTASFDDLAASVDPASLTVLLDVETGTRVPHYVEREDFPADPARAALVIHPSVPLRNSARYVVGIRGLVDEQGAPVVSPTAFAALRDGVATDDADTERQRDHYDTVIFPALDAAGFDRADTVLAWDFVTESTETALATMRAVRDDGLARVGDAGPAYTIGRVRDDDCSAEGAVRGRVIEGTFTAPLYLEEDAPGTVLSRAADGTPQYTGDTEVPFAVVVPCSVLAAGVPAPIVQFGHGLFGQYGDVESGAWVEAAHAGGFILFATTWRGMGADDVDAITLMMATDPSAFAIIPDGLTQGHLEAMIALRMMRTRMLAEPSLLVGETPLVDPDRFSFMGLSLGSVIGGAQVAMSPEHTRAVMQIAGMPFSQLLTRSSAFEAFLLLLGAKYDDPVAVSLIVPLAQMLWEPVESGGWANLLVDGAAEGGVDGRRFLVQVGIGDDTVTSIGGEVYARTVGARLIEPAVRDVYGVEPLTDGTTGSGLTEWDYGYPENPVPAPQGLDPDPHWLVPGEASAIEQVVRFIRDGELVAPCDGPCDPD